MSFFLVIIVADFRVSWRINRQHYMTFVIPRCYKTESEHFSSKISQFIGPYCENSIWAELDANTLQARRRRARITYFNLYALLSYAAVELCAVKRYWISLQQPPRTTLVRTVWILPTEVVQLYSNIETSPNFISNTYGRTQSCLKEVKSFTRTVWCQIQEENPYKTDCG